MYREIQQRLQWVKFYETSGDAGFICRRLKRSPSTKTGTCEVALIRELRSQRNLGARLIQSELKRLTGNSNNPQSPLPESG